MPKISRRLIEKQFTIFLALLSQNQDSELEVVDRRGKTLFFVRSPQKTSKNVPIQSNLTLSKGQMPSIISQKATSYKNSVNVPITQENAYEEQPHFTPIEPWTP